MNKLRSFDLISDLHLEHWVKSISWKNAILEMDIFINSILPKETSKVLVIAGDLSDYNDLSFLFLCKIKDYYEYILIVAGNHDYYLMGAKNKELYQNDSNNRLNELKKLLKNLNNVYLLEGDIIEIDGIKFGGCSMWYDLKYGVNVLNYSLTQILDRWESNMSDSHHIQGFVSQIMNMYNQEDKRLESIVDASDVIITHVSPDWSKIEEKFKQSVETSYFYFDGSKYFNNINGKIWCYGHTHTKHSYMNYGCWFINNALGYDYENNILNSPIVNISIDINDRLY